MTPETGVIVMLAIAGLSGLVILLAAAIVHKILN